MSAQVLGARWLRRAHRITGLEPVRGWSHGGYWLGFVTKDHVHYVVHTSSREWELSECPSYGSCAERWGADRTPDRVAFAVAELLELLSQGPEAAFEREERMRPAGPRVRPATDLENALLRGLTR